MSLPAGSRNAANGAKSRGADGSATSGQQSREVGSREATRNPRWRGMNAELFELPAAEALEQDERYTTRETMAWCERMAGVDAWDLDVAACEESHKAPAFFTVSQDGLAQCWGRGNVWCNPPYSDIAPWVSKAWAEMADSRGPKTIAMLIPASRTEQRWWHDDVEKWRDLGDDANRWRWDHCEFFTRFLPGRTRFGHPGNPEGVGVGSPPFGCVLLVWRRS